jgi:hypothetical protein
MLTDTSRKHPDRSSDMPQQNRPVTDRPKVEDESVGNGSEQHGRHREGDEALPGRGSGKGGLNRSGSGAEAADDAGTRQGSGDAAQRDNASR